MAEERQNAFGARQINVQLDEKQLKDAIRQFARIDTDGDGRLSREEFRDGLGSLGMDVEFAAILFNAFDTNGDGNISKDEFLTAMAVMLHPDDTEQQVSMAFDAYDTNKDGKLDLQEITQVIRAMFAAMVKLGIRKVNAEPTPESAAAGLFRAMDVDAKGYVTKENYLWLARENPDLLKKIGLG